MLNGEQHYFILLHFNKPFSTNKQHKYTHNGSKNQSFLYNTNGITHKSTHIHFYYSRPDIAETTITTTMQLVILNGWTFLHPVNT